jgi:[acyl-carrier-protein] S-malonyltransferase
VTNVDARATTAPDDLRDALVRQVSAPVRWVESMQLLIAGGVDTFVEAGPGKVLSGLMRQISRDVKMLNVEDAASLETTSAALAA